MDWKKRLSGIKVGDLVKAIGSPCYDDNCCIINGFYDTCTVTKMDGEKFVLESKRKNTCTFDSKFLEKVNR